MTRPSRKVLQSEKLQTTKVQNSLCLLHYIICQQIYRPEPLLTIVISSNVTHFFARCYLLCPLPSFPRALYRFTKNKIKIPLFPS